jgi:hypothetical protein
VQFEARTSASLWWGCRRSQLLAAVGIDGELHQFVDTGHMWPNPEIGHLKWTNNRAPGSTSRTPTWAPSSGEPPARHLPIGSAAGAARHAGGLHRSGRLSAQSCHHAPTGYLNHCV